MTSFVRKQPVRLMLVLSMLATGLALSACHGSADENQGPDDRDVAASEVGDTAADSNTANQDAINADTMASEAISGKMSVEDAMINNLSRYRWTLISATDSHDQPLDMLMQITDQVRLSLNQYQGQNTLNYSVGCNTVSAAYQLQGTALTIEDSMSTKMSCGDLNTAENLLNTLMQGSSELSVSEGEPPLLTQVTNESMTLVWTGRLTAQAKYNGKGKTIFWAVNSKEVACDEGDSRMCLQVKPITYDDQGIKSSEGKWVTFKGEIDGYQHDDTHEEVLRLQRYQINDAENPDDDSTDAYAYVLDAVIESSVIE